MEKLLQEVLKMVEIYTGINSTNRGTNNENELDLALLLLALLEALFNIYQENL